MKTLFSAFCVVAYLTAGAMGGTAAFGNKNFTFPEDYTLELAAGAPLVERPMEACFDDRGRLFITESSGSNDPVEKQLEDKPHRLLRLEDTDGDGVFDKRSVFADKLMFPSGCLWHAGSVYVAAPPQIWKFTDADDDGIAEKREVWFDGKTLTGCANDLHGPYLGPDGWIYWCKGAFAEQTYNLPGQPGWKSSAAHVFRAKPDGSALEPVFTAGMDNPVGLEWTPEGEMIVAGTFLQEPAAGRRDGLIHAVYGGVWGKVNDVLAGHPRTGGLMPPMTHQGPGAPCGIARYGRDLLVAQFNLRIVSRHKMIPEGASFRTEDSHLLTCDHPNFHPTDVLQAPDGSVLVVDTGGWYKLCCPTSQLAQPNVHGGIYRLRKKDGEVPVAMPAAQWLVGDPTDAALQIKNLESPNPQIRRRAAEALGRAKVRTAVPGILAALAAPEVDRFLFHSLTYALLQIQDPSGTRGGLASSNATVQAAALFALDQMTGGDLLSSEVIPRLGSEDARLQEAAAFVVARYPAWASELVPWFAGRLQANPTGDEILKNTLRSYLGEVAIRKWIGEELANAPSQSFLLSVMAAARMDALPEEWTAPLAVLLTKNIAVEQVLAVLAAAPPAAEAGFEDSFSRFGSDDALPVTARLAALAQRSNKALSTPEFTFALAQLKAGKGAAATLLRDARLTDSQLLNLAPLVGTAGILDRLPLLKAFGGNQNADVGKALLSSISPSAILTNLPRESVTEAFASFPQKTRDDLETARSSSTPPDQRARLDELEKSLGEGDAQRGALVFQSTKAACSVCHPLGYAGGHFGPDLGRIGAVRTRRDLIEAIVYPSASFVRSYETVQITRNDGTQAFGIITKQSPESLTITSAAGSPPVSILRSDVKQVTSIPLSLMPLGLDYILSPAELADVIAYLLSSK